MPYAVFGIVLGLEYKTVSSYINSNAFASDVIMFIYRCIASVFLVRCNGP